MPWVEHYLLTRPFPRRLYYRDGALDLEVVEDGRHWQFRARKLTAETVCVLWQADSRRALEEDLYEAGFPAQRQFIAPQRMVMERLVREGFAVTTRLKLNSKTGARY